MLLNLLWLQVSTNGLISFQSPYSSFRVSHFSSSPIPLIAPLWADFDFREAGHVNYRVTENAATLIRAREMILEVNPGFSGFYPLLCVIVTWASETTQFSKLSRVWELNVIITELPYSRGVLSSHQLVVPVNISTH